MKPTLMLFVLAIAGIAGCTNPHAKVSGSGGKNGPAGFKEVASASGIEFKMRFLPNEQGETYKVNL